MSDYNDPLDRLHAQLVVAWIKWDHQKRDEYAALVMEEVCCEFAKAISIPPTKFRDALAKNRRDGLSRQDAIWASV